MSILTASRRFTPLSSSRVATILRYLLVGASTSVMDYALFALLNAVLGIPAWAANITSYSSSSVVNYLMHRRWTFGHRSQQSAAAQFAQYVLMVIIAMAANTWLVTLLGPLFSGLFEDAVPASVVAKAASALILWAWNLASSNFVVFRGRQAAV